MLKTAKELFRQNVAWATKETWNIWHFYFDATFPICSIGPNLLADDTDIIVHKGHPDFTACERCIEVGIERGLWRI